MTPAAQTCIALVLKHEGGLVDNPADPGGLTNFGISQHYYPTVDIRNLTAEAAAAIYEHDYWQPISGDLLPLPLAMVTLDAAVMSGIRPAAKWMQEAIGVTADGSIGAKTIAAAAACDMVSAVSMACTARLAFLKGLPTWQPFGNGWNARVNDTQASALHLISAAPAA